MTGPRQPPERAAEPTAATRRRWGRSRRLVLIGLVLLGLSVTWYAVAWVRHGPPLTGELASIAHRGAFVGSGTAEGSRAAFEAAIGGGADWLELDVRRTRDGVLVVHHDATLERTTDGTGAIADLTLAQLRAIPGGDSDRIPTVEDIVRLVAGTGVRLLPEIKDGPANPGLTGQLVDLLRAHAALDAAVIQAFEAETLEELARLAPEAHACWLTGLGQLDLAEPPADAAYLCPMAEMLLLAPDAIRQAHAEERTVFAWWGAAERRAGNAILAAFGVDGLMVDDLASLP